MPNGFWWMRDWRIDAARGTFLPFFTDQGASGSGSFGPLRTVNGAISPTIAVPADAMIRVRLLNIDATRIAEIGLRQGSGTVIAVDGIAVEPFQLTDWWLGPAMRLDLALRSGAPGSTIELIDNFAEVPQVLARFTAGGAAVESPVGTGPALRAGRMPMPDLAKAERLRFELAATATGARLASPGSDDFARVIMDSLCLSQQSFWAMNKQSWPGGDHAPLPPPLAALRQGQSYVIEVKNVSQVRHPIHLHGHSFRVLSSNRRSLPVHWADTVLVAPRERVAIRVSGRQSRQLDVPLPSDRASGGRHDGLSEDRMRRPAIALMLAVVAVPGPVAARDLDGAIGEKLFRRQWVGAPASVAASDGLGPLYNALSCAGCHGANGNGGTARVIHLQSRDGRPDPTYGFQIQDKALPGFTPEAKVAFAESGAGKRPVVLPQLLLAGPALDPATVMTVRRAPDLAAVGRIAAASDAAILAHADPDDRDGDGISGRPAMVIEDGQPKLGRYGWRATAASLGRQISLAFATDLGMSSRDVPRPAGDCTAVQAACVAAPNGRDGRGEEIAPAIVDALRRFLMQRGAEPPPSRSAAALRQAWLRRLPRSGAGHGHGRQGGAVLRPPAACDGGWPLRRHGTGRCRARRMANRAARRHRPPGPPAAA